MLISTDSSRVPDIINCPAYFSLSTTKRLADYSGVNVILNCIRALSIGKTFLSSVKMTTAYGFADLLVLTLHLHSFIAFIMIDTGN